MKYLILIAVIITSNLQLIICQGKLNHFHMQEISHRSIQGVGLDVS